MRLIFITQRVDPDDPFLGATVAKIRALAAHCDELVVFADSFAPCTLPVNVRKHAFASPSRTGRGLRFLRALVGELARRPRPIAVVAHMCPIYAVLAAPLARPLGVGVVLWYTHWKRTPDLAIASRLAHAIVTVDRASVPVESGNVVEIGHGIDVSAFGPADPRPADGVFRAVALGRYATSKGLETIIRAVGDARARGIDLRLTCHGPVGSAEEVAEQERLGALVERLGLSDSVRLAGPVPRSDVPTILARSDALVNNMRAGAADKVVFEACASARPILASNPSFGELVRGIEPDLLFQREDAEELGERLGALASLSGEQRQTIGDELRRRVVAAHSVESWAAGIVRACLASARRAHRSVDQRPTAS
jgi:glycosyltransferase involved in cell wall biosynthesis